MAMSQLILDIGKRYPEITGPISDAFAAEVNNVVVNGDFSELVLDFSGTRIVSSMAMGTLFSVYQKLRDDGKALRVVNASEKVRHLLKMVNLSEILE